MAAMWVDGWFGKEIGGEQEDLGHGELPDVLSSFW